MKNNEKKITAMASLIRDPTRSAKIALNLTHDPTGPDPARPDPRMDPIRVHLWFNTVVRCGCHPGAPPVSHFPRAGKCPFESGARKSAGVVLHGESRVPSTRAAVGMGIPMGLGMVWVWGL